MGIVKEYNIKAIINTLNTTYFKVPAAVILASLILVAVAVLSGIKLCVYAYKLIFDEKHKEHILLRCEHSGILGAAYYALGI